MIKNIVHHAGKIVFSTLNCISKLGYSSLVKRDCAPKRNTFAPSDENYRYLLTFLTQLNPSALN